MQNTHQACWPGAEGWETGDWAGLPEPRPRPWEYPQKHLKQRDTAWCWGRGIRAAPKGSTGGQSRQTERASQGREAEGRGVHCEETALTRCEIRSWLQVLSRSAPGAVG